MIALCTGHSLAAREVSRTYIDSTLKPSILSEDFTSDLYSSVLYQCILGANLLLNFSSSLTETYFAMPTQRSTTQRSTVDEFDEFVRRSYNFKYQEPGLNRCRASRTQSGTAAYGERSFPSTPSSSPDSVYPENGEIMASFASRRCTYTDHESPISYTVNWRHLHAHSVDDRSLNNRKNSDTTDDRFKPEDDAIEDLGYRLRSFSTSSKGIINRGDTWQIQSPDDTRSSGSSQHPSTHNSSEDLASSSEGSMCDTISTSSSSAATASYKVLVLGSANVGKMSLIQQFMTSEYIDINGMSPISLSNYSVTNTAAWHEAQTVLYFVLEYHSKEAT